MISFRHKGNYKKLEKYLDKVQKVSKATDFDKFGMMGVVALASMTPIDSGKTAESWEYEIEHSDGSAVIRFNNSNINDGVNIAIILQYGHGVDGGGWVEGRDYINPAIQPVFDRMAEDLWQEVCGA